MTRSFLLRTALESNVQLSNQVALLSDEEFAEVENCAEAELADATSELAQIETADATAQGLEDLAVVADTIEEATPAETQLIEVAGDLAVAGTDVPSEDVIPAMESFIGGKINTQGLRDKARALWAEIKKWVIAFWGKIENFFALFFSGIPNLRNSIKKVKARAEEKANSELKDPKVTTFQVSTGLDRLSVDNKPANTFESLVKALATTTAESKNILGASAFQVSAVKAIVAGMKDFKPRSVADAEAGCAAIAKSVMAVTLSDNMKGNTGSFKERFRGQEISASAPLLGNKSVVATVPSHTMGDSSVLGALAAIRQMGFHVISTNDTQIKEKAASFEILSPGEVIRICDQCQGLIDAMEEFVKKGARTNLKKAAAELQSATDTMIAGFEKESFEGQVGVEQYVRGLSNMNVAMAKWGTQPYTSLIKHDVSVLKSVMSLAARSLDQYAAAK
jgi:hypothetical protein